MNEIANDANVDQEMPSFYIRILPYFHDIITQKRTWQSLLNFILIYCGLRPIVRFLVKRMISQYFKTIKYNPYFAHFPPRLDISSVAGSCLLKTKVFTENETKNILQACKANHNCNWSSRNCGQSCSL